VVKFERGIMTDDHERARRAVDFQARAKEYPLINLPGYLEWSERKLREGESEALIANLDSLAMVLLPEDVATVSDELFEDMLQDLKASLRE
jgi:hypothetical protein